MTDSTKSNFAATVDLSEDEAVVLFELLSRWSEEDWLSIGNSVAEHAVLNTVLGTLERQLVAPFKADYLEILEAARARLTSG